MNYHFSFYIGVGKIGTVTTYGDFAFLSDGDHNNKNIVTKSNDAIDLPLTKFTHDPEYSKYVILMDKSIIYDGHKYDCMREIPHQFRYTVLPQANIDRILQYSAKNKIDDILIAKRYVKELIAAKHILVPSSIDNPSEIDGIELLIRDYENGYLYLFDGRKGFINMDDIIGEDGKYLYINKLPTYGPDESKIILPATYTFDSLRDKYLYLNEKLNDYSLHRNDVIYKMLSNIADEFVDRLNNPLTNKFQLTMMYNPVSELSDTLLKYSK